MDEPNAYAVNTKIADSPEEAYAWFMASLETFFSGEVEGEAEALPSWMGNPSTPTFTIISQTRPMGLLNVRPVKSEEEDGPWRYHIPPPLPPSGGPVPLRSEPGPDRIFDEMPSLSDLFGMFENCVPDACMVQSSFFGSSDGYQGCSYCPPANSA